MPSMKSLRSLVLIVGAVAFGGAFALAQETPGGAGSDEETEAANATENAMDVSDEIVVTARMREELLSEVPESISVFDADLIELAQIEEIADFSQLTPGVVVQQGFQGGDRPIIVFRGVGQIGGSAPSVILLSDGIYLPVGDPLRNQLFDIERIEVVKGPQGSLYGRDTIGGVINVITRAPSPRHAGRFQASYMDESDESQFAGAVNLPLWQERLMGRISAAKLDSDGFFKNLSGANQDFRDEAFVRARLRGVLSDAWELDLRLGYNDFDNGYNAAFYAFDADTYLDDVGGLLNAVDYDEGFNKRQVYDAAVRIEGELPLGTFTSITQAVDSEQNLVQDADFQFAPPLQIVRDSLTEEDSWSQELRLASASSSSLDWLVGLFHEQSTFSFSYTDTEIFVPVGVLGFAANEVDTTRSALFAQLGGNLSAKLLGSLALRYDRSERDLEVFLPSPTNDSIDFDRVTPKASLLYAWTGNTRTYLTYSEGFRSGAFDAVTNIPYDEEILKSFELGLKGEYLERRLDLTLAAYHYDYEDQQVAVVITDPISGNLVVTTENLGESQADGVELGIGYRPTHSLTFTLGIDTLDTEILADPDPSVIGNKTPFSTDFTVTLTGQHTHPLSSGRLLVSRIEYYYQGDQTWDKANTQVQSPYGLLSATLALEAEHWSVALSGENLLDEKYNDQIFANFGVPGLNAVYPGLPARVRLTLRARY